MVPATPARKNGAGTTVIAHISDLHFTSQTDFNKQPWDALLSDLKHGESKIDLLVVTGDLIDAPVTGRLTDLRSSVVSKFPEFASKRLPDSFRRDEIGEAFTKVSDYLKKLCNALDINPVSSLFVVPGNHDYRLKGIIRSETQPGKFYNVFKDYCRPLLLPTLNVCVFVLDSNVMEAADFAAGRIDKEDLVQFYDLASLVPTEHSNCTRIVLMHHHPMPIAHTEREGFLNKPGLTMLNNAGQVMTSMVAAKIDLILHGHEHYPAYSKAFFPYDTLTEHLITVVSAGSVGKPDGNYNLITITDNGQIHLQRRSLATGIQYQHEYDRDLRNYEDARRAVFHSLAVAAGAKLKIEKSSRLNVIKSGSGDVDMHERSENVRAYSTQVGEWPTYLNSQSGFFFEPEYDTTNVRWEWEKDDDKRQPETRRAKIIFDPPLTKDNPITYERVSKNFNLFQFNQQDRLDITNGASNREEYEFGVQNAYDVSMLTLSFPKHRFPEHLNYYVEDMNGQFDSYETAYFVKHISELRRFDSILISLEQPLPGYKYKITWELPESEADEGKLSGEDKGRADEIVKRLLSAKETSDVHHSLVRQWLDNLRHKIISSKIWSELIGDDDLETSLYIYNPIQRGLVCVCAKLQANSFIDPWEGIIKPGGTFIGEAHRRRGPSFYSPLSAETFDMDEHNARIPEIWRQAMSTGDRYVAACAIPLFYPILRGRRIGVVAFASRSNISKLLGILPDKNDNDLKNKEKQARQKPLIENVMGKRFIQLTDALGIPCSTARAN
jgi:3',5'-cyclic AMP phosphodiesterase CpdA